MVVVIYQAMENCKQFLPAGKQHNFLIANSKQIANDFIKVHIFLWALVWCYTNYGARIVFYKNAQGIK